MYLHIYRINTYQTNILNCDSNLSLRVSPSYVFSVGFEGLDVTVSSFCESTSISAMFISTVRHSTTVLSVVDDFVVLATVDAKRKEQKECIRCRPQTAKRILKHVQ